MEREIRGLSADIEVVDAGLYSIGLARIANIDTIACAKGVKIDVREIMEERTVYFSYEEDVFVGVPAISEVIFLIAKVEIQMQPVGKSHEAQFAPEETRVFEVLEFSGLVGPVTINESVAGEELRICAEFQGMVRIGTFVFFQQEFGRCGINRERGAGKKERRKSKESRSCSHDSFPPTV